MRAALLNLQEEGLLEPLPGGGCVVKPFSEAEIRDAIEVRGTPRAAGDDGGQRAGAPPGRARRGTAARVARADEKAHNERLCACVSRVCGGGVVLDSAYRPDPPMPGRHTS